MLQLAMTDFWINAIFSGTTSRPRFPRDRMMPSAALAIPLKLNSDCRDSSLATTCNDSPACQLQSKVGFMLLQVMPSTGHVLASIRNGGMGA